MKRACRILAMFMAFILVLGAIPSVVYADTVSLYEDEQPIEETPTLPVPAGIMPLSGETTIAAWNLQLTAGQTATSFAATGGANTANTSLQALWVPDAGQPGATQALTMGTWTDANPRAVQVTGAGRPGVGMQLPDRLWWQAELSTVGFTDVAVSWNTRSTDSGPRDFRLEFSTNGTTWTPANSPAITSTTATWPTALSGTLPTGANNQSTLFIRWIVSDNVAVNGGVISTAATTATQINNIIITGQPIIDTIAQANAMPAGTSVTIEGFMSGRAQLVGGANSNSEFFIQDGTNPNDGIVLTGGNFQAHMNTWVRVTGTRAAWGVNANGITTSTANITPISAPISAPNLSVPTQIQLSDLAPAATSGHAGGYRFMLVSLERVQVLERNASGGAPANAALVGLANGQRIELRAPGEGTALPDFAQDGAWIEVVRANVGWNNARGAVQLLHAEIALTTPPPTTPIATARTQYNGTGTRVTIEGYITGSQAPNVAFMQAPNASNPNEGILVTLDNAGSFTGQRVQVTGYVRSIQGHLRLDNANTGSSSPVTATVINANVSQITPVPISLAQALSGDFEGMLISITDPIQITTRTVGANEQQHTLASPANIFRMSFSHPAGTWDNVANGTWVYVHRGHAFNFTDGHRIYSTRHNDVATFDMTGINNANRISIHIPPPAELTATPASSHEFPHDATAPIQVTLATTTAGAVIVYSVNGGAEQVSTGNSVAVTLDSFPATITARARVGTAPDFVWSSATPQTFTYTQAAAPIPPEPPTANPASGALSPGGHPVNFSTVTAGAEIRFRIGIDGVFGNWQTGSTANIPSNPSATSRNIVIEAYSRLTTTNISSTATFNFTQAALSGQTYTLTVTVTGNASPPGTVTFVGSASPTITRVGTTNVWAFTSNAPLEGSVRLWRPPIETLLTPVTAANYNANREASMTINFEIPDTLRVHSHAELSSAMVLAEIRGSDPTTIYLMNDISRPTGLVQAITVPSSANVILTSYPGGPMRTMLQPYMQSDVADMRHFVVRGSLQLENVVLCGGNPATHSGGVNVTSGGTLILDGGIIQNSNVSATAGGGGVSVATGSTFIMYDGIIRDNHAGNGGGVWIGQDSSFVMHGGTITGNTAASNGGGVFILTEHPNVPDGSFVKLLPDASVTGNTAPTQIFPWNDYYAITFNLEGGNINGNLGPFAVQAYPTPNMLVLLELLAITNPTHPDYVFSGWSITQDGAVIANLAAFSFTGNDVFYAQWEEVTNNNQTTPPSTPGTGTPSIPGTTPSPTQTPTPTPVPQVTQTPTPSPTPPIDEPIEEPELIEEEEPIEEPTYEIHLAYMFGNRGLFRPHDHLTRAEAAGIFVRTKLPSYIAGNLPPVGSDIFADVAPNRWYAPYIAWAYYAGFITGDPPGSNGERNFRPQDPITRQEFIALMVRATGYFVEGSPNFADNDSISPWARNYVNTAYVMGWVEGNRGNFNPRSFITRAEVATAINRLLGRIASLSDLGSITIVNPEDIREFSDVSPTNWFYAAVLAASNDHRITDRVLFEILQ